MANERKPIMEQQKVRKLGRAGKGKKEDFIIILDDPYKKDKNKLNEIILQAPSDGKIGVKAKMAKGGRAGLKGGGICKKGMNRKAIGKNS